MNNWQRCLRLSIPVVLAFGLVACGNSKTPTNSTDATAAAADAAAAPAPLTAAPTKITNTIPLAQPPTSG
jgi:hypothetical protein